MCSRSTEAQRDRKGTRRRTGLSRGPEGEQSAWCRGGGPDQPESDSGLSRPCTGPSKCHSPPHTLGVTAPSSFLPIQTLPESVCGSLPPCPEPKNPSQRPLVTPCSAAVDVTTLSVPHASPFRTFVAVLFTSASPAPAPELGHLLDHPPRQQGQYESCQGPGAAASQQVPTLTTLTSWRGDGQWIAMSADPIVSECGPREQ